MDMNIKKCKITRYDPTITIGPFKTIQIDEVSIEKPLTDNLGETLYNRMAMACHEKGYKIKFYTLSDTQEYDYEIVIH